MIWGCQWDAMVNFIGDPKLSPAPNAREKTGAYGDVANNVYDTSTGLRDWTAAASFTFSRAARGGDYESSNAASDRNYNVYSYKESSNNGARVQLYIK